jgi:4-hydroxybenzoate polyprenyltransferase
VKLLAWGRLLRLSLAPSAAADIAAGLCLGAWGVLPARRESLLLIVASLCVYHGGMALNDWADREADARTRPARPVPSGAVSPRGALTAGVALLLVGSALAFLTTPAAGLMLTAVAICAAFYDVAGRGPRRGPLLLALCRGGNLASGVLLGARAAEQGGVSGAPHLAWLACALYAGYVFFASRLGRLEDDEDEAALARRPSRALGSAALCLVALPAASLLPLGPVSPPETARSTVAAAAAVRILPWLVATVGAWRLLGEALRPSWTRAQVGRATGMALRRLLVFTATCALVAVLPALRSAQQGRVWPDVDGLPWLLTAGAILLGYPLSYGLRRVFPPT